MKKMLSRRNPVNYFLILAWNSATLFLLLALSRRVLEPETKVLDAWSRSLKFKFRLHSPATLASSQAG